MLLLVLMLAGCGSKTEKDSAYLTVRANEGRIEIEKELLSEDVRYVNYDTGDQMMQLLAGVASDGSFRVALNTCQSCNPSPKAYFVQENGKLICQNCGNVFTMDDVGNQAFGCNPTYIESTQTEEKIVVTAEEPQTYAPMFSNWGGPTDDVDN